MADGNPKDYSRVYEEDNLNIKNDSKTSTRGRLNKSLDGSLYPPKHREQTIDLRRLVSKIENLPNQGAYAMETLKEHYAVFNSKSKKDEFRVYLKYSDENDTYVVRVESNTLRAVKDKLPKRGNYRYFFKGSENTCEEVEYYDAEVPFHEKNGLKQIYCRIFPSY